MRGLLLVVSALTVSCVAVSPPDGSSDIPFCELGVCQCRNGASLRCTCNAHTQEIYLQNLPRSIGTITIENCNKVTVAEGSIKDIKPLRKVTFNNIAHLELQENSFLWDTTKLMDVYLEPGLDLQITKTTIPTLPEAFKGHYHSIHLDAVTIHSVQPLAFADMGKVDRINITNCHIENIESQAFRKFILESFIIEGSYIGNLPSYTFNSVQVLNEFKLEDVHFRAIRTRAFKINDPKMFRLRSSRIQLLEGEAFQIVTRGNIFIDDNVIDEIHTGAFVGIYPDPRYVSNMGSQEFVFDNNTLTNFHEYSLTFNSSGIKPIIDRIVLNQQCTCNDIKSWSKNLVKYTSGKAPDFSNQMWCKKGKADTVFSDYVKHCSSNPSKIPVVVMTIIGVLICLIGICSVGFWLFRKHAKSYMNVPTTENKENNRVSILVIPERKIYTEQELHVMTESVEPIKDYITPQGITHPI